MVFSTRGRCNDVAMKYFSPDNKKIWLYGSTAQDWQRWIVKMAIRIILKNKCFIKSWAFVYLNPDGEKTTIVNQKVLPLFKIHTSKSPKFMHYL